MNNVKLKELWAPIANGEERIEDWWKRNELIVTSITNVDTEKDVVIWSASFYRYAMYLYKNGYSKQSMEYVNKAIEILESNKRIVHVQLYEDSLEKLLSSKVNILQRIEKYWEAYKITCTLCNMKPDKDSYRLARRNLLRSSIVKVISPIYIVLIFIFALILCEIYLTHTHFIPSVVRKLACVGWIVLLLIHYVVPVIINKIQK